MTFEEASALFALLQAQWQQGLIQPAQFQQTVAQLQVMDPQGRWWQIEPYSAQWLMWNGSQWLTAQQLQPTPAPVYTPQPAPVAAPPRPAAPAATTAVPARPQRMAAWEGLVSVAPGFVIQILQGWPSYQKDPKMLASFAVPTLLPAILVPLARYIGRFVSILLVLGCLAWLSWPFLSHASELIGNPQGIQKQAGRGLVGVSLLYLIPRIWRAGK
jgi:hypothetical protein